MLSLEFLYKGPHIREIIPRSGLRVGPDLLCLERNSTCHFKLSLVTFSGTPFSVIFIFSSGAQCIYQHCTAQALTPSQALIHKNLYVVCACVHACVRACVRRRQQRVCMHTQGGRSWLKFINFLWANEAPCAFFPLTNETDGEAGSGCCLATAGRISDHVRPIVLSCLPERHHMLCVEIC